jgi:hypothetical protein
MSTDNNAKEVREWDFRINLSGVAAPTGGLALPEGYYKATITDMYVKEDKPDRVIIKVTVSEGVYKGTVRTSGINIPKDEKDAARYYWRGLAESVGYGPAQLDNGEISLGAGAFKDKLSHINYVPKQEEGGYDQVKFLPVAAWAENKQAFEAREAAGEAQPARQAPRTGNALGAKPKNESLGAPAAVTPAGGSALGGTATKSGILNKLGVGAA